MHKANLGNRLRNNETNTSTGITSIRHRFTIGEIAQTLRNINPQTPFFPKFTLSQRSIHLPALSPDTIYLLKHAFRSHIEDMFVAYWNRYDQNKSFLKLILKYNLFFNSILKKETPVELYDFAACAFINLGPAYNDHALKLYSLVYQKNPFNLNACRFLADHYFGNRNYKKVQEIASLIVDTRPKTLYQHSQYFLLMKHYIKSLISQGKIMDASRACSSLHERYYNKALRIPAQSVADSLHPANKRFSHTYKDFQEFLQYNYIFFLAARADIDQAIMEANELYTNPSERVQVLCSIARQLSVHNREVIAFDILNHILDRSNCSHFLPKPLLYNVHVERVNLSFYYWNEPFFYIEADACVDASREFLRAFPGNPQALSSLAKAYVFDENFQRAIATLRAFHSYYPDCPNTTQYIVDFCNFIFVEYLKQFPKDLDLDSPEECQAGIDTRENTLKLLTTSQLPMGFPPCVTAKFFEEILLLIDKIEEHEDFDVDFIIPVMHTFQKTLRFVVPRDRLSASLVLAQINVMIGKKLVAYGTHQEYFQNAISYFDDVYGMNPKLILKNPQDMQNFISCLVWSLDPEDHKLALQLISPLKDHPDYNTFYKEWSPVLLHRIAQHEKADQAQ